MKKVYACVFVRFGTYIRREGAERLWGLLFGFQMKFNKKGRNVPVYSCVEIYTSS